MVPIVLATIYVKDKDSPFSEEDFIFATFLGVVAAPTWAVVIPALILLVVAFFVFRTVVKVLRKDSNVIYSREVPSE